jgi:phospholipid transport system transporter-binding protein
MTVLAVSETLDFSTASTLLACGMAHMIADADRIDCAQLLHFDSSALAVLLAWQRAACQRGVRLEIINIPEKLLSLARAYGIDRLLHT